MTAKPLVDGYTETLNHRKIIRKHKKLTTFWKPPN